MSYVIAGLGNPGEEYSNTRHNTGRIVLDYFRKENDFSDWKENKKYKALISEGKVGKQKVILVEPDNFMNNSGKSLASIVTSARGSEKLIVVYDDIDLPIGTIKVSYSRGSGGHRGVESIIKSLKTKSFIRLRVGVAPTTPSGKIKKPKGEQGVVDFLMGEFKSKECDILKKANMLSAEAVKSIILEGKERAMGEFNQ